MWKCDAGGNTRIDQARVGAFDPLVKEKNFGLCVSCATCPSAGNPVNFATGNKYEMQRDFSLHGPGLPMGYVRYYNSQNDYDGYMGYGWAGTFSESVSLDGGKIILTGIRWHRSVF